MSIVDELQFVAESESALKRIGFSRQCHHHLLHLVDYSVNHDISRLPELHRFTQVNTV